MISASGVREIISIPRENKIIFLIPYADMFPCFKQKHTFFFFRKQDLLFYVILFLVLIKQDKHTE